MSRKHSTKRKPISIGPVEIVAGKSKVKLKSIPTKKVPNLTDKLDRKRRVAAEYYRSKRRGFNNGDEIEDWLEIEE